MKVPLEKLQDMFIRQNRSMREIADEIGESRSWVAGMLRRGRLQGLVRAKREPRAKAPAVPNMRSPEAQKEDRVGEGSKERMPIPAAPVSFLEARDRHCRFPLDYKMDGFPACCGGDIVSGTPYCRGHVGICYAPGYRPRGWEHRRIGE